MSEFFEGFLLQASLILALGAQNIFVLESGLKKRSQYLVALICSFCDAVLIFLGVAGAASFFVQTPWLKIAFGVLGVIFLLFYAVQKLIEGIRSSEVGPYEEIAAFSVKKTVILALSFSLLNPHVYLDTIILIGGYSAKFSEFSKRMEFGAGAASFSMLWFFILAAFAYFLRKPLESPNTMKMISLISGVILLVLSWKLGLEVYKWSAEL